MCHVHSAVPRGHRADIWCGQELPGYISRQARKELIGIRARGRIRCLRPGEVIHFAVDLASSLCLVLSGLAELT